MKIGMVGLGKMGGGMTRRLLKGGHEVVVYDVNADAVAALVEDSAEGATSLEDLTAKLEAPRAVWVMVPAGDITEQTIANLGEVLSAGDVVIDGGNSKYTDTLARYERLKAKGISLVDAGTSGGVWGLEVGFSLMVGADDEVFDRLEPVFATLAPEGGYGHMGRTGSGHYVKMVHNGIEYGLMQAYAEGFEILERCDFEVDLHQIAEVWRNGSVIRSWLLDLAARALEEDPTLEKVAPWVDDSGEGRWTVEEAIELAVPAPVIAGALFARFASRDDDSFGLKMLAALRHQFGGHATRSE